MSSPSFPQEIFDQIVDSVASGRDRKALFSLNLTSQRHFLHRSRSRIFYTVTIAGNIPSLLSLFEGTESLGEHVQRIVLDLTFNAVLAYIRTQRKAQYRLTCLMDRFPNARLLHLIGDGTAHDDLHPTCIAVINKLMAYPLARLLSICHIPDLPASILESLSNLHTLELGEGVNLVHVGGDEVRNQTGPWCLQILRCESKGIIALPGLNSHYPPSTHRGLRVIVIQEIEFPARHTAAWSFIIEVSKVAALEVISLTYTDFKIDLAFGFSIIKCFKAKSFTLPSIPTLRFLRIKVFHKGGRGSLNSYLELSSFLPLFPLVLLQGAPQPSLEVVDLVYACSTSEYGAGSGARFTVDHYDYFSSVRRDYRDWAALDDVLSDKINFPRLQALRISSKYRYYHEDNSDQTNTTVKEIADKWGLETLAAMPKSAERIPLVDVGVDTRVTKRFKEASRWAKDLIRRDGDEAWSN
ncbi:hypothetical protein DFP72DRAFT_873222 [Ephemerocybe angulata]|uniref:Uncharacterized protein n=1 Tax=Ephemerocybe angulata TaxID=980116 RepID=A0A8H6IDR8_9AGAR|nr:hypothetical protein DFP72DRAFT_873222 [Tulosesus angulatus]